MIFLQSTKYEVRGRRGARRVVAALLGLLAALALSVGVTAAHPLGNFTISSYSRLDFAAPAGEYPAVRVTYVADWAEIPTFQQMKRLDRDSDGVLSADEAAAFLDADLPGLVQNLKLTVGGRAVPLAVADRAATFVPGQGGLPTLRIEAHLTGALPGGVQGSSAVGYSDGNYRDRLGWREIVVRGGPGVAVEVPAELTADLSDELRSYPQDLLSSPLSRTEATFSVAPGDGASATRAGSGRVKQGARGPLGGDATTKVAALVQIERLTPTAILIAILAAVFWGAAHALSPGHGKAVVAAYLIGTRGTPRHAVFLGLTVTITHTAGVLALGAVTLWLSRYILPERLYPWLNVLSGAAVVAIGLTLAWQRLRPAPVVADHEHDFAADDYASGLVHSHGGRVHSHLPPGANSSRVTWRSLFALGVSGGLIPCPSALVLLLGSIALGRVGFGLVLVLAFSLGLAGVLTAIGLLCVYSRRLFGRFSLEPRVPRLLPVASALAISFAGLLIVVGALRQAGVV